MIENLVAHEYRISRPKLLGKFREAPDGLRIGGAVFVGNLSRVDEADFGVEMIHAAKDVEAVFDQKLFEWLGGAFVPFHADVIDAPKKAGCGEFGQDAPFAAFAIHFDDDGFSIGGIKERREDLGSVAELDFFLPAFGARQV